MVICGIKFTHDGAIALIDNGKLIFCYEMEKLNNNNRYASILELGFKSIKQFLDEFLDEILKQYGYDQKKIDKFVIDGWSGRFDPDAEEQNDFSRFKLELEDDKGESFWIETEGYGRWITDENILTGMSFDYPNIGFSYNSYKHVSGHVLSAYCTSPFAKKNEDAFVLVWDGAMISQLFYINNGEKTVENLGAITSLIGSLYGTFACYYEPYKSKVKSSMDMSVAGKVMAYIAKGTCNSDALKEFKRLFHAKEEQYKSSSIHKIMAQFTYNLEREFWIYGEENDISGADMMATLHVFIEEILIEKLKIEVNKHPHKKKNLCFSGGCALNIKWNSAIRNSGIFDAMWVPPFPNDSGSAVGVACCEMLVSTGNFVLDWDVYSGPFVRQDNEISNEWDSCFCSINMLASLIHNAGEPVVFLSGRAELGPRALGNRSILAAPVSDKMKAELNRIKGREDYRPVAPICIEEDAPGIFSPGSPDPLMLYDHMVKDNWKDKIPAVCHIDGSARLQTINRKSNPVVFELLEEYKKLSAIPLLCNTSANYNGKGFFPDVSSVIEWGQVNMIWSEGRLFFKRDILSRIRIFLNDDRQRVSI